MGNVAAPQLDAVRESAERTEVPRRSGAASGGAAPVVKVADDNPRRAADGAAPNANAPSASAAKAEVQRKGGGSLAVLASVGLLVAMAYVTSRIGNWKPGSRVGYDLGLWGGILMLLLFVYPLRKHVRALHNWGATKYWFIVHMVLGLGGPFLILVHSQFHIGSINAGVAMFCMLIVAGSGVIGRFLYVEIHHGLTGEKINLLELQAQAGINSTEVKSKLSFAPEVERRLLDFEARALKRRSGFGQALRFMTLGLRRRAVLIKCTDELRRVLRSRAQERQWDRAKYLRRMRSARRLTADYLEGVRRVSQYTAYVRLFSLWHILHVPLVYMLVLSAIAHVVAVHMY